MDAGKTRHLLTTPLRELLQVDTYSTGSTEERESRGIQRIKIRKRSTAQNLRVPNTLHPNDIIHSAT